MQQCIIVLTTSGISANRSKLQVIQTQFKGFWTLSIPICSDLLVVRINEKYSRDWFENCLQKRIKKQLCKSRFADQIDITKELLLGVTKYFQIFGRGLADYIGMFNWIIENNGTILSEIRQSAHLPIFKLSLLDLYQSFIMSKLNWRESYHFLLKYVIDTKIHLSDLINKFKVIFKTVCENVNNFFS